MPKTVLEEYLQLVSQLPGLPATTLDDYFRSAEPSSWQKTVLEGVGHLTIHEFMCLTVESWQNGTHEDGYADFEVLAEISREPLNHLDALFALYRVAVLDRAAA